MWTDVPNTFTQLTHCQMHVSLFASLDVLSVPCYNLTCLLDDGVISREREIKREMSSQKSQFPTWNA